VRVPLGAGVERLLVRTTPDGGIVLADAAVDRRTATEAWWRCEVEVRNPVTNYRFLMDGPGGYRWLNGEGIVGSDPTDAADFRLASAPAPPDWAADAVFYEIFPDRFANSGAERPWPSWTVRAGWGDPLVHRGRDAVRQLFGGDLPGIESRLDHLEALGVNAVYLTPFFPAESYHRYDASSFDTVDPVLGGDEALASLSRALHARGMRLVGDLTLNHCGRTHPWFVRAQAEPASVEASFFHRESEDFAYWVGIRTLPKFDHRSEELRRRLYQGPGSALARWLQPPFSLDGWRIDVANMAGRFGAVDLTRDVARWARETMHAVRPDGYLVAEHMHDASQDLMGDGWHGTMYYSGFTWPVWAWLGRGEVAAGSRFMGNPLMPSVDGETAAGAMDVFRAAIPWRSFAHNLTLLGSHDTPRWRTVASSAEAALVGVGLLLTYPGIPSVLYGDEIGLGGQWGEDGRRPMPWDPAGWDMDALEAYRSLISLRRGSEALRRGGLRWVHAGADSLTFLRESPGERILVHAARATHGPVRLSAAELEMEEPASHILGGADLVVRDGRVSLPADGPAFHAWRM
jgi:alpha-glucosidase